MITRILGSAVICAVGRGPEQVWAATRAGISRISESVVLDSGFEPIKMALVAEDALPEIPSGSLDLRLPPRLQRMLQLACPLVSELIPLCDRAPVPLFVGLPQVSKADETWATTFIDLLRATTSLSCDAARSQSFALGRAATFAAMEAALESLHANPEQPVIVGGVDTYLDLQLLAELDAERRILNEEVMDGFVPGEGAAFMVLSADPRSHGVQVVAAVTCNDPGHRYGSEPARGEGLATALSRLRASSSDNISPIGTVFAGFNGESFDAKLWGVARIRHRDLFDSATTIEHPADTFGDTGAATGAILTVLAATALAKAQRKGPVLVWACSDLELRGCVLLR